MKGNTVRHGFTLIEVLIVVVILAVLAATIIPQFTDSTEDAQESVLLTNLKILRTQIQVYRAHHGGLAPSGDLSELLTSFFVSSADTAGSAVAPNINDKVVANLVLLKVL